MKILVTGGAGFIGTNLIKQLLFRGFKVHSIDNYSIGKQENHQSGAEYFNLDVLEINKLNYKYDLIFHLAGLSRIQPSFDQPFETFQSNTQGVKTVLEWARKFKTKVIYSGSSSFHHDPYQSPYAFYKYLGEEICKMYRKNYEMNIEIVRFYNVYGPYEIVDGKWAAVIGIWRSLAEKNKVIPIVGDGNQRRDFTHVDDIVDGLIKIGFSKKNYNDQWELGSGKNYSLNEVYNFFHKKFNVGKRYIKDQKGNYRETLRHDNKAIDLLEWNPKDRLEDYINNL